MDYVDIMLFDYLNCYHVLLPVVNRISLSFLLSFHNMNGNVTIEEAFGKAIKKLRKEKNLSQEGLAAASSLDRSFISLLENGRKQPSLVTIFQLAKALDIVPSQLIANAEELLRSPQ